jgi:hypothetical protein
MTFAVDEVDRIADPRATHATEVVMFVAGDGQLARA